MYAGVEIQGKWSRLFTSTKDVDANYLSLHNWIQNHHPNKMAIRIVLELDLEYLYIYLPQTDFGQMYLRTNVKLQLLPFLFITVAIVAVVAVVERNEKPFIHSVISR